MSELLRPRRTIPCSPIVVFLPRHPSQVVFVDPYDWLDPKPLTIAITTPAICWPTSSGSGVKSQLKIRLFHVLYMGPFWGPILSPRPPSQLCSVLVISPLLPWFCFHMSHPCTHAILFSYVFLILLVDRGLWPRVYSAGKTKKVIFDCCCLFSLLLKSNVIAPLLLL